MTLEIDETWLNDSPWGYKLKYVYVISRQFLQVVYFFNLFFQNFHVFMNQGKLYQQH